VRRAVCNLSVCRKVNRQYKHNLSCTVHDHRRPYRRIIVRRHFIESFTRNATITDDFEDGLQSIGISHRASLEMPQSPTTLWTYYSLSAFHIELHWKCHNHRWRCRWISSVNIHREWWKCHNHRWLCGWIIVRRHLSAVHNYRQIHRWMVRIPKGEY
jgi:hypothetical protein